MNFKRYFLKKKFSTGQVVGMLTAVIVGVSVLAYATVTIPYTFIAGTTASSSEVNANFTALANAINNRTPATLANMAGTWSYNSFASYLTNGVSITSQLCTNAHLGTLTLNADGTFSAVDTTVNNFCVGSTGSNIYTNTGSTFTGTWTVSADGLVTFNIGGINMLFLQASRDLNTMVASDNGSQLNGNYTATYVRQ